MMQKRVESLIFNEPNSGGLLQVFSTQPGKRPGAAGGVNHSPLHQLYELLTASSFRTPDPRVCEIVDTSCAEILFFLPIIELLARTELFSDCKLSLVQLLLRVNYIKCSA